MIQPCELCPRFEHCSINQCTLNSDYARLVTMDCDPENKRCGVAKIIRLRLGTGLKNKGMTLREQSSKRNWENLSVEEREARTAKLAKNSPFVQLKAKRGTITHVSENEPQKPLATGIESSPGAITEDTTNPKDKEASFVLSTLQNSGSPPLLGEETK